MGIISIRTVHKSHLGSLSFVFDLSTLCKHSKLVINSHKYICCIRLYRISDLFHLIQYLEFGLVHDTVILYHVSIIINASLILNKIIESMKVICLFSIVMISDNSYVAILLNFLVITCTT